MTFWLARESTQQDEVARSIAERLEPSTLIDLAEARDAHRLADLLGRDLRADDANRCPAR